MARMNLDESKLDREKYEYRLVGEDRTSAYTSKGWEATDQKTEGQVLLQRKRETARSEPQNATEETIQFEEGKADAAAKADNDSTRTRKTK